MTPQASTSAIGGKRIVVVSDMLLGSHRAHAINVVKTAGGFLRLGCEVALLCAGVAAPDGETPGPTDAATIRERLAMYAEQGISVLCPPREVLASAGSDDDRARIFGKWAARQALALRPSFVYARHFAGAIECVNVGLTTVMETHAHIGDPRPILDEAFALTRREFCPLDGIATIAPVLRDHYISRGADRSRVLVVPDGVDPEMFARPAALPANPLIAPNSRGAKIVYTGHLYDYKGIPTILDAAARLRQHMWHLVGGTPEDISRIRDEIARRALTNVIVHGAVPHREVPAYLWHADVLLLPPSAQHPSAAWTSPVKLGEYLASGTPIIASDIPALRLWIDDSIARWFQADDGRDLVRSVEATLAERPVDRARRAANAAAKAREFSYARRAERLLALAEISGERHGALLFKRASA